MTDDMMNLRSLVEKSADADLLREMIGFATNQLHHAPGHDLRMAHNREPPAFAASRRL